MSLASLPPELLYTILSHLDIPSLISFSTTNSTNHAHHLRALHTLHLAIFPKKVQCLIAFLQHSDTSASALQHPHQVSITLPQRPSKRTSPSSYRNSVILSQNAHLATLLTRYSAGLATLTFHAWDLLPSTASALASLPRLRHLSLCFEHAVARDPCLPAHYFRDPPPASTLWNALAGLGEAAEGNLRLRNLVTLRLERAGCTSKQLQGIVARNAGLREVRCRKVRGVDGEFVDWLGNGEGAERARSVLEVLVVEDCEGLVLRKEEQFDWIARSTVLRTLTISRCPGVSELMLRKVTEGLKIDVRGCWDEIDAVERRCDGVMEVDESCL